MLEPRFAVTPKMVRLICKGQRLKDKNKKRDEKKVTEQLLSVNALHRLTDVALA